jgi:hypothetical protein
LSSLQEYSLVINRQRRALRIIPSKKSIIIANSKDKVVASSKNTVFDNKAILNIKNNQSAHVQAIESMKYTNTNPNEKIKF